MSEAQSPVAPQNHPINDALTNVNVSPAGQQGAGDMLRSARESRGMHIAALAVLLKVPVKKLEALESDRFDLLPDAVFVRALASSVCRTLKVDTEIVLSRLPRTDVPNLTYRGAGINEPFRAPGDGPKPALWAQVSRPAVFAGLMLLLGALVLIFLPAIKAGIDKVGLEAMLFKVNTGESVKPVSTVQAPQTPLADSQSMTASSVSLQPSAVMIAVPPQVPPATSLDSSASTAPEAAKNPTVASLQNVLPASQTLMSSQSPLPADIVVFVAKAESWVEATDAKGQIVLRRTLSAGDVAGASGALPLKIVVGRADVTQVQIRGQMFDVNAVAKDNVAKFEVK